MPDTGTCSAEELARNRTPPDALPRSVRVVLLRLKREARKWDAKGEDDYADGIMHAVNAIEQEHSTKGKT